MYSYITEIPHISITLTSIEDRANHLHSRSCGVHITDDRLRLSVNVQYIKLPRPDIWQKILLNATLAVYANFLAKIVSFVVVSLQHLSGHALVDMKKVDGN